MHALLWCSESGISIRKLIVQNTGPLFRTEEEVERILNFAKLTSAELKPAVQCVNFAPSIDNEVFKLIELDEDVIDQLQAGQKLTFRGDRSDSAVLCSSNKTYEVRGAETSNLLLLMPDCTMGEQLMDEKSLAHKQVLCMKHEYFETKVIKPRISRLRELLLQSPYTGQLEDCENPSDTLYTFEALLNRVQASEEELLKALKDIQAFILDGHWRVLDFAYMDKVLSSIISLKDENAWEYSSIPVEKACRDLDELYPSDVTKHVLNCFGAVNDEGIVSLSDDAVCRFFAEVILKATITMNFDDFESTWKLSVPDGMATSLCQLEGLAIIDTESRPPVIEYFPSFNLPEDVTARFSSLFTKKTKWTLEEITPYIRDVATKKMGISALLTKFARGSTQKGIKYFTSKRPL